MNVTAYKSLNVGDCLKNVSISRYIVVKYLLVIIVIYIIVPKYASAECFGSPYNKFELIKTSKYLVDDIECSVNNEKIWKISNRRLVPSLSVEKAISKNPRQLRAVASSTIETNKELLKNSGVSIGAFSGFDSLNFTDPTNGSKGILDSKTSNGMELTFVYAKENITLSTGIGFNNVKLNESNFNIPNTDQHLQNIFFRILYGSNLKVGIGAQMRDAQYLTVQNEEFILESTQVASGSIILNSSLYRAEKAKFGVEVRVGLSQSKKLQDIKINEGSKVNLSFYGESQLKNFIIFSKTEFSQHVFSTDELEINNKHLRLTAGVKFEF